MSERSRPCQKRQWLAGKRFFGLRACFTRKKKLRACFTPGVKHALSSIGGGRGSEMGCTVGRTPGGLTAGRGRGVLGLGGLRACEGV